MKQFPSILEYEHSVRNKLFPNEKLSFFPTYRSGNELYIEPGNKAVVFKVLNHTNFQYALKFFTINNEQVFSEYNEISKFLNNLDSNFLVDFEFERELIFCEGINNNDEDNYFPGLIMEWAEGISLGSKIRQFCVRNNKKGLTELCEKFKALSLFILTSEFGHGDLKHDNIIVDSNNDLKLIDYDGIFIPAFKGQQSSELGTPSFQHPLRTNKDFNKNIDDFSILIIYTSLLALSKNPKLYNEFNDQQNIIFTSEDFQDPYNSKLIQLLETDDLIKPFVEQIKSSLFSHGIYIPYLKHILNPPKIISADASYYNTLYIQLTNDRATQEKIIYELKDDIKKLQKENVLLSQNIHTYKTEYAQLKLKFNKCNKENKEFSENLSLSSDKIIGLQRELDRLCKLKDKAELSLLEENALKRAKEETITKLNWELENEQKTNYTSALSFLSVFLVIIFVTFSINPGCNPFTSASIPTLESADQTYFLQDSIKGLGLQLEAQTEALATAQEKLKLIYKNTPFVINSIRFENSAKPGVYSNKFRFRDVRYIAPILEIIPLVENLDADIFVKIKNPDGRVNRNPSISPNGYTYLYNKEYFLSNNKVFLNGWGSDEAGAFENGTHRVEIFYKGKILGSGKFMIIE